MKKKNQNRALVLTISTVLSAASASVVLAQDQGLQPEVKQAIHHDVSPPLRDIPSLLPLSNVMRVIPLRTLPFVASPSQVDPVEQKSVGPLVNTTSPLNFAGVGNGDYNFTVTRIPPDPNLAVGGLLSGQVVQMVNNSYAVFDKSGTLLLGPTSTSMVWAGFGGGCEGSNVSDPIVQYDRVNDRWVLSQLAASTTDNLECIAVSTSPDATGTYNRYSFDYGTQLNDYPKLGVWPDAYYLSFNMFNGKNFAGAKVCAYDSAAMRNNTTAAQVCFQLTNKSPAKLPFGLLPSDLDGSTPPPAGSPNFFLNFGKNSLNLWKFHVDFTTPANSTFTGPTVIPVAAFNPFNATASIPQPGTPQKLDSVGDRLMYRLAYRNFLGDHESLVVNHTVSVGNGKNAVASVRWYELRSPNGTPTVFQQGTLSTADGIFRWMGSIAMDKLGDMAVGYSASNSSVFPSIRYTGRVSTDPLGVMQSENSIQDGFGPQALVNSANRWGDYSSMRIDPSDDCTFWYTNEYIRSFNDILWSTTISSFKFNGCN